MEDGGTRGQGSLRRRSLVFRTAPVGHRTQRAVTLNAMFLFSKRESSQARLEYMDLFKICFIFNHVYIFSCCSMHVSVVTCGGQKRALDLQKLELEAVVSCPMWVLSPLQEQPVFLIAKPPPQSLGTCIYTSRKNSKGRQAPWLPGAGLPHRASFHYGFMKASIAYGDRVTQADSVPPMLEWTTFPTAFKYASEMTETKQRNKQFSYSGRMWSTHSCWWAHGTFPSPQKHSGGQWCSCMATLEGLGFPSAPKVMFDKH